MSTMDWPQIQMIFGAVGVYTNLLDDYQRFFGFDKEQLAPIYNPVLGNDSFSFFPCLRNNCVSINHLFMSIRQMISEKFIFFIVRPKSVGEITLKNKKAHTRPIIDPKYLSNPEDVKILVEGRNFICIHTKI